jgi:hypothetical protein
MARNGKLIFIVKRSFGKGVMVKRFDVAQKKVMGNFCCMINYNGWCKD